MGIDIGRRQRYLDFRAPSSPCFDPSKTAQGFPEAGKVGVGSGTAFAEGTCGADARLALAALAALRHKRPHDATGRFPEKA